MPKLVEDFLITALNNQTYRDKLYWVDRESGVFRIKWTHPSSYCWDRRDLEVFWDWERLKKRDVTSTPEKYTNSKQIFRSALRKLDSIQALKSKVPGYKEYKIKNYPNSSTDTNKRCNMSPPIESIERNFENMKIEIPGRSIDENKENIFPVSPAIETVERNCEDMEIEMPAANIAENIEDISPLANYRTRPSDDDYAAAKGLLSLDQLLIKDYLRSPSEEELIVTETTSSY